ncbi:zinc finger CCCH domain-containing protein 39 isoform X2 [Mangifera indica]|nr:zinc finger CCCH domain-containing protein 39 isoform X2 [Mangifera indica]
MNNEQQYEQHSQFEQQPPLKRPRNFEENQSNPSQFPRMNPSLNPPINKGTANIFFKTRICAKFKQGTCRNGENCNFAHGLEDLRQPPPNWQDLVGGGGGRVEEDRSSGGGGNWDDDHKIIHNMKLCKKFYNGEECPYGDRCNFLHEDPSKFRDDSGRYRESSAISIGTTGPPVVHGVSFNQSDSNRSVNNTTVKPVYWKTKLCSKWTTGQCPFGEKCHFAHGESELQVTGVRIEVEAGNAGFVPVKPHLIPVNDSSTTANMPTLNKEGQGKKCLFKWKGPKKINRIYGDWLDDMPLVHNWSSQVES